MDGNHGGIHPKGDDFVSSGVPFVAASDINNGSLSFRTCKYIKQSQASQLRKGFAEEGDVLLTHKATIGRTAIVPKHKYPLIVLTPQVTYYRVKDQSKLSNKFLKYYFDSAEFQSILGNWAGGGSTRAYLSITNQHGLPVTLPPLETQKAIAHILGTLDDKIELNRRMNETLEAMAQALFKSWFVDFDPVKAKMEGRQPEGMDAETAALFPDKLVESELGLIPEGWQVGSLKKVATLETTTVKPFNEPGRTWEHYSIPAFDTDKLPLNETGGEIKSNKYAVPPNCVLASKLNPQFPRVWLPKVQRTESAICSTEFMPFVPKESSDRPFLYELFRSSRMQEVIINKATGSTGSRQRVKPKEIAVLPIVVPTRSVLEAFNLLALPLQDKEALAIESSGHLGKVRDTLLPKLMSGELEV